MAKVAETSPPPAMNFNIPVKVTMLVQVIVCFGIIASTVSITRSVVQSNVAKLNANLGHLHRPSGQVKSNPASAPNSTAVISNSTLTANATVPSHTEELDYTKLHGYIISNKERRYNSSKVVLDKLGLVSHQHVPLSYKSDAIRKAMEDFHVGNQRYLTDRYKKVFSNRMAFAHLFQDFFDDPKAAPASWRFFFEDDVALHPSLTKALAQKVLARGLEVAAGDGILYLGICGPNRCEKKTVVLSSPVEAMRCAGACTHAFGLTKWKTGGLLAYMDKLKTPNNVNVSVMYFDQLLRTYGEQVHRIWVLGSNLKSPQMNNHYGLVYQDRTNYPSVIMSKEPKQ
ncbi:hypothetical protein KC19_4G160700 [Ceratodon purpureus]|uniref:Uncharacterized protein n=1 Tax=Ceratodon purpureus TaxID=3225 RepID=A0A8T0ICT7_CERPU|nr:hypothetical protein KC19_4G160700 [Ceratodon purpureus]